MNDLERMIRQTTTASGRVKAPPAPGAMSSPQLPGETPDHSDIPGHEFTRVPALRGEIRRPTTQAETAAGQLGLLEPVDEELQIADFEIGPVSDAEARNAYPWQATASWPVADFRLDRGMAEIEPGAEG